MADAWLAGFGSAQRTVYFTDVLLETFPPAEIRAIPAHKLCHGRLRHLPVRLAYALGFLFFCNGLQYLILAPDHRWDFFSPAAFALFLELYPLLALVGVSFLLVYYYVVPPAG